MQFEELEGHGDGDGEGDGDGNGNGDEGYLNMKMGIGDWEGCDWVRWGWESRDVSVTLLKGLDKHFCFALVTIEVPIIR